MRGEGVQIRVTVVGVKRSCRRLTKVKVTYTVEGKSAIQKTFRGRVLCRRRGLLNASILVRCVLCGIDAQLPTVISVLFNSLERGTVDSNTVVERRFFLHSPSVVGVEVSAAGYAICCKQYSAWMITACP